MKTITVEVREDHLENLARTKPITAIAELIWNALDAEAGKVKVEFVENELGGIEAIRITDDGIGLHYDDAFIVFRNLGGSWKRKGFRTHQRRRMLHGKYGKGRFRAFSMGNRVSWNTVYEEAGKRFAYQITGRADTLGAFDICDARGKPEAPTGMTVVIETVLPQADVLRGVKALEEITQVFAPYMRQYPDVRIIYDGVPLDPANAEDRQSHHDLGELVMQNGERVTATLTIVEWNIPRKRGLMLCDAQGFMLHHALDRLHFRGFSYTAYLRSEHLAQLDREGMLQMEELSPDVKQLLDAARTRLRQHFALREAEQARVLIRHWQESGLYPYQGTPADSREENERRIFDIYASHLNQIFPDFAGSTGRNKRLMLRFIQELIRTDPTRVARVIDEVLEFPEEKEEEVMELAGGSSAG
jgi:hypothetical protein